MPSNSNVVVQRLHSNLPLDHMQELLESSRTEGWNMIARLIEHWESGRNRFEQAGEGLWLACVQEQLAGIGGLNRDPYTDLGYGRVRHLYVLPVYRRAGVGRALTTAVIEAAHGHFETLVLRTLNPEAVLFYQDLGFQPSTIPDATHELQLG